MAAFLSHVVFPSPEQIETVQSGEAVVCNGTCVSVKTEVDHSSEPAGEVMCRYRLLIGPTPSIRYAGSGEFEITLNKAFAENLLPMPRGGNGIEMSQLKKSDDGLIHQVAILPDKILDQSSVVVHLCQSGAR